jgi:hypothetical protein
MDLLTGSLPNGSLRFEPSQKATARRIRGRASVSLPGSFGYLAARLAEAIRFRDRLRSQGPTKAQLAQEHLAFIRSGALTCTSKKDLLAQMRRYASDEVSIDTLGELALVLESDIQFASRLRDARAIRAFLRRRLG